jgi:glycogen debranching enzyme
VNPDFRPLPNAIAAEGMSPWYGPGDRGDMAMIAYGAARFALAYGDRATAEELWRLITWCLEYCRRRVNAQGAVASESDELEGRFPAGKANLCTSALYYDALNSAVLLGRELSRPETEIGPYKEQADRIRSAIETAFGANIQGFDAYRYYDGNTALRAWIGIPLTMGIFDRKRGVMDALFSPAMWTEDGIKSISGDNTFFDRSTLYALRGAFAAGETDRAMDFLGRYTRRRLLGDHVPYPVEWGPAGSQPHLAAESALYCRVYTEGLFGIRPTGFRSFAITPALPKSWASMKLSKIHAFGSVFDLMITRAGGKLQLDTSVEGRRLPPQVFDPGAIIRVDLSLQK